MAIRHALFVVLLVRGIADPAGTVVDRLAQFIAIGIAFVGVMAANYRREARAAGTPIDAAAEVLARLFFSMTEELVLLCLDDTTWNRDTLVDFLTEFIEGGMAGVRPEVWRATDRAHRHH
jgi:hypothetical protein